MGLVVGAARLAKAFRGLSSVAKLGSRLSDGGGNNGYFSREEWESSYPDVLENAKAKAGNAGQTTILNDYWYPAAEEYCDKEGENFDKESFLDYINNEIGDDKFNAVNIISEEAADELETIWDNSYGGDGIGPKLYRNNLGKAYSFNYISNFRGGSAAVNLSGISGNKSSFVTRTKTLTGINAGNSMTKTSTRVTYRFKNLKGNWQTTSYARKGRRGNLR